MRDVFFTILAVWVLWKIFSGRIVTQSFTFNTQNNHPPEQEKKEGEVKIDYQKPSQKKKDNDEGEYVDYEEIK
jgi:hypothetical protein